MEFIELDDQDDINDEIFSQIMAIVELLDLKGILSIGEFDTFRSRAQVQIEQMRAKSRDDDEAEDKKP